MGRATKQSRASEPQPPRRRRHDATYKTLGQEVLVVRDLLRNFAAKDWHHELVLPTLVSFPTETVGPDLKRRLTDVAWRVQLRDGRWLVVFFEFQSSRDPGMAVRTLLYSAAVLATLQRSEELRRLRGPDGELPLVLAFVIYTGRPRQWGGPELERVSARRAFAKWTEERMRAVGAPPAMLVDIKEQVANPTEEEDIVQTYAEWAEGHRAAGWQKGRQEGREEGREEGGRAMLVRLVSSRFGADAGTRLAEMVRGMGRGGAGAGRRRRDEVQHGRRAPGGRKQRSDLARCERRRGAVSRPKKRESMWSQELDVELRSRHLSSLRGPADPPQASGR